MKRRLIRAGKELEGNLENENMFWKKRYDENTEITGDILNDRDKLIAENQRLRDRIKELETELPK